MVALARSSNSVSAAMERLVGRARFTYMASPPVGMTCARRAAHLTPRSSPRTARVYDGWRARHTAPQAQMESDDTAELYGTDISPGSACTPTDADREVASWCTATPHTISRTPASSTKDGSCC